jgi:methylated-DNA-[protein]-cysteine S-methyltransferase
MVPMETTTATVFEYGSPIGPLTLVLAAGVLRELALAATSPSPRTTTDELDAAGAEVVAALDRYFAGDVCALDTITVRATGSPFQQQVWDALRRIPGGETCSYAELARVVGTPNAPRAVGRANATNPVAIVVPCHRVIRSDGSLGGYGGGLDRKRWLLQHERVHTADLLTAGTAARGTPRPAATGGSRVRG